MKKADFLNTTWVLIPATGIGDRAGMGYPKQYVKINNKTILDYTIDIFKEAGFKNILVVLDEKDSFFKPEKNIDTCLGGETRYLSVLSGLNYLIQKKINQDHWVFVHDAVRPCLAMQDLHKLIESVLYGNLLETSAAILAKPVSDTLKYSSSREEALIQHTLCRKNIWQALTPQASNLSNLIQAFAQIHHMSEQELDRITDEAYLIEKLGLEVKLIQADFPNPKFTYQQDLDYIHYLLEKKC